MSVVCIVDSVVYWTCHLPCNLLNRVRPTQPSLFRQTLAVPIMLLTSTQLN